MSTSFETLLIEDRGTTRIITINRPQVLNALSEQVIAELSLALEALGLPEASGVRALILTGAGEKSFVAGADIAAMATMSVDQAMVFATQGHAVGEMLSNLSIPVIAAVNGFALGGGCELALACDFIVAAQNAKFGQPEVKLGVIPGFGGTQRLLRRVGLARALELCCTGATIDANQAALYGLVNHVVPQGEALATALGLAEQIAKMGPLAVASAKQVLHRGAELPLEAANQLEVEAFAELFSTADQREGMAAFIAKRAAVFEGR